ncbi:MAG: hypothetical protein U0Q18_06530 [Bryobacteraceae bacterium]
MRKLMVLGLIASIPLSLTAARLTLRDGTTYHGTFVSGDSHTITFREDNGERHTIDLDRVRSLDFRSPTNSDTIANRSAEAASAMPAMIPAATAASPSKTSGAVIPAGRRIALRTNEPIDTTTADEGRSYAAIVAQDITTASGEVLVPRGSGARMVVHQDANSRTNSGRPDLVLDLESVAVNGRVYRVAPAGVSGMMGADKASGAQPSGTGSARLGTQIGAVAGEGEHTPIGAAPSVAGVSTAVLTRGREIKVPADTLLDFQLDRPLNLQPER